MIVRLNKNVKYAEDIDGLIIANKTDALMLANNIITQLLIYDEVELEKQFDEMPKFPQKAGGNANL